jgi:hypothetical protein
MATQKSKQELAANRLCSRLSPLRATLRKDERDMLDQMVCSAAISFSPAAEVVAHTLVASGAAAGAATAISFSVVDGVYCAVAK